MILLLVATASAAPPSVTADQAGRVTGWVDIPATPSATFAMVSDPRRVSDIWGRNTVTASTQGSCLLVNNTSPHALGTVRYRFRSCPEGPLRVREVLVDGDLEQYEGLWSIEPRGDNVRLHFTLLVKPKMWVPQWLLTKNAVGQVRGSLSALRHHLQSSSTRDHP